MMEVEAREALERYLKGWGAAISFGVAVVAIASAILGWSLKSQIDKLQASVKSAESTVALQAESVKRVEGSSRQIRRVNFKARDQRSLLREAVDTMLPGKASKLQLIKTVPQTDTGG